MNDELGDAKGILKTKGGIELYFSAEYSRELEETLQQMDPKLRDILQDAFEKMMDTKLVLIDQCNTPIEKLLAIPLDDMVEDLPAMPSNIRVVAANCVTQRQISIKEKNYVVDFLIQVLLANDYVLHFVIECDGHDFHEKTKKQVRSDKKRERTLLSYGYHVIRFSGSEIYDDPYECCVEIEKIIKTQIEELFLNGNLLDK